MRRKECPFLIYPLVEEAVLCFPKASNGCENFEYKVPRAFHARGESWGEKMKEKERAVSQTDRMAVDISRRAIT